MNESGLSPASAVRFRERKHGKRGAYCSIAAMAMLGMLASTVCPCVSANASDQMSGSN
jgi:hypothetical protein